MIYIYDVTSLEYYEKKLLVASHLPYLDTFGIVEMAYREYNLFFQETLTVLECKLM